MTEGVERIESRFTSILKLDRPLSPMDVNSLRRDGNFWDREGAVSLVQYIFLEDVWKNFFKCLANNISKPMRSNEEASELDSLEQERDQLAREHYILRKKNVRAISLIGKFQDSFQAYHDKQSKTASEIYMFAEKLRADHLLLKEQLSSKIESTKSNLESQRKANTTMLDELKALQSEVDTLAGRFNKEDLSTLDKKIEAMVRGSRLSNVGNSNC